jgi:hypothetical protein
MRNRLILMWGWLSLLSGGASQPFAQSVPHDTLFEVPRGDTLPEIRMKFEPLFLIPIVVVPAAGLFLGGHSYQINGKKQFVASAVKPYFDASRDPVLTELHTQYTRNRIIWYSTTAAGSALIYVGFMQVLVAVITLNSSALQSVNPLLWWGGGLGVAGIAARIVCFRQLRKAVNYYNFKYVGPNPAMSLHLGLPSTTPIGLGLYFKF